MSRVAAFRMDAHPVVLLRPQLAFPFAWAGHIPFAYLLIDLLRPQQLVELGTDSGNSYLAFCQAVAHLQTNTRCVAVDSWQGDAQAGRFGDDIYTRLKSRHDPLYGGFSQLKRCLFDDAVHDFADASIDVLHIDGLHSLEAVRHDVERWWPKLSDRAVLLLHDTRVQGRGFGVQQVFAELAERHPSFEFNHSNGLGVIQVGSSPPAAWVGFMAAVQANPEAMRRWFEALASTIVSADGRAAAEIEVATPDLVCSVFFRSREAHFDESCSVTTEIDANAGTQHVQLVLPDALRPDYIRIDPGEVPGAFGIRQLTLRCASDPCDAFAVGDLRGRIGHLQGDPVPVDDPACLRLVALERDPWVEIDVGDIVARMPTHGAITVAFDLVVEAALVEPRLWAVADLQAKALSQVREASTRDFDVRGLASQLRDDQNDRQQQVQRLSSDLLDMGKQLQSRIQQTEDHARDVHAHWLQRAEDADRHKQTLAAHTQASLDVLKQRLQQLDDRVDSRLFALESQASDLTLRLTGMRRSLSHQDAALRLLLGRGLPARIRRLLARSSQDGDVLGAQAVTPKGVWLDFQLRPLRHLQVVAGQAQRWRALGNDPGFACDNAVFPLQAGWYRVQLEFEQHQGPGAQVSLYPDYGPDVAIDVRGLPMAFVRRGAVVHDGLVCLTHVVHALRLDPATTPCEFSLRRLRLQRIGRVTAARQLLHAMAIDPAAPERHPYWRVLTMLARGHVHQAGQWLYRSYAKNPEAGPRDYAHWLSLYDLSSAADLAQARAASAGWSRQPLMSVLVPTFNSDARWLRRCLQSVLCQALPHWELCIADDASTAPHVTAILREFAGRDTRIKLVERERNGHISAASNSALAMATGEFVVLLDHDDELHPMALFEVARAVNAHPAWQVIYSDEDKLDAEGRRYDPYFKPDWNYDLLLSHNCISHLGVYARQLVLDAGGFREGLEGSQDWDLALRCIERVDATAVGHIPRVLYHWRAVSGSTALAASAKNYARVAARRAIEEHLQRVGADAVVDELDTRPGNFHIRYALVQPPPRVTLVIPTRDALHLLRRSVDSILAMTTYLNYEIVIVDNQSRERETLAWLRDVVDDARVRVIHYDHPFNYSAMNNWAVAHTDGDVVGLINNDIELITPNWLEEMVGHAMRKDVGAVGAMLYYPDERIQHAGVILGVHGVAAHAYGGRPRGYPGHMGRATLTQSMSAVTAACMLVRRHVFDEVGGLNESLRIAFNDIDFCLRVRRAGYRNVWTPFAQLYHHESATRGYEDSQEKQARFASEVAYMREQWGDVLRADPAYNPNFTLNDAPFDLAFPPHDWLPARPPA